MFCIFSILILWQTIHSQFHPSSQNNSQEHVTLHLTQSQANKVYDVLNNDIDNRMLPGMGQSSKRRKGKYRKSNVLNLFYPFNDCVLVIDRKRGLFLWEG